MTESPSRRATAVAGAHQLPGTWAARSPDAIAAALCAVLLAAASAGCRTSDQAAQPSAAPATPSAAALEAIRELDAVAAAGRASDALAMADALAQREPGVPEIAFARAMLTRQTSGHDDAVPIFLEALALDHDHQPSLLELARGYVERAREADAEPYLRRLLAAKANHGVGAAMLARVLIARGEADDALAVLQRAESSGHPEVFELIGRAQRALGDDVEAERYLRRAMDLDPRNLAAMLQLGQLLVATGRTQEGEEILDRHSALAADADALDFAAQSSQVVGASAENFMALGETRRQQGDLEGASEAFRQAADRAPQSAQPLLGLATIALQQRRFGEALVHAQQGASNEPSLPLGQLLLGVALIHAERADQAVAALERARQLSPWSTREWEMVGQAYYESGRLPDAIAAYEAGLEQAPDDDVLALRLGFLHYLAGDLDGARTVLAPAAARATDDAELALALAMTLDALGDPDAGAMLAEAATRARAGSEAPAALAQRMAMFPDSEALRVRFIELATGAAP